MREILNHFLFSDIEDKNLILSSSKILHFKKGESIFEIEDIPKYLYILLSGVVYVCENTLEGKRNIIAVFEERGECFGEVVLFLDAPYPYYTLMAQEGELLAIPKDFVLSHMSKAMNKVLAKKAFNLSNKIQLLSKASLREKILHYLSSHPQTPLKRYELADFLGVSRPALSKEILAMIKEGVIIEENKTKTLKIVI
ncbi:Crp/Fnr family transcriptional regulator [Helicobacter brantae]|uniref:Crp/Fnr family transcriptional regulator n=1 Tax=Helicobacter brantae TaxID=375927 RepID=A0A3D8J2I1_9HELI|nr:Crp/Fnr family transcriptional regulator [Helicobacter brantae]RDU70971.1 Crp/Fnr family transcriptional regulator [Helicobacter brantae]